MRINKIPEDAVLITGTTDEYVDPRGNIYGINHRKNQPEYPFLREQNENFGYKYCKIRGKSARVHRIVAEMFIPNPDNLPIVMHINNDKKDNRVENLKWGTVSENTKQAYEDGLAYNAKGEDDSQSIAVDMYSTTTNKLVKSYGSITEASKETGIQKKTIALQIKTDAPIRKQFYFVPKGAGPRNHYIIIDDKGHRYCNMGDASRKTGIADSTISSQVNRNGNFRKVFLKCEEVIENDK